MKTQKYTYIGKRLTSKDKLAFFWLREGEETPLGYSKNTVRFVMVGQSYQFTLTDDNKLYVGGDHAPMLISEELDSNREKWIAQEQAAIAQYGEIKAKKSKIAESDLFAKVMLPLKRMMDTLTMEERHYFVQRVSTELWRRLK